jgi:hypothetical protein
MVSRVERGVVPPSLDLLNRSPRSDGGAAGRALGLYSHAAQNISDRRGRGRGVVIVDGMAERERVADVVRLFPTSMIPALLQTE